ncbi:MAG: SDR family oxidoreductase [bacterium]|nr:SDR family oxidoreductase [bacterium]
MNLKNKIVVITGGSRGLGESLAYAFAKKHACVVLCALEETELKQVCGHIQKSGEACDYARVDVTDKDDVEQFIKKTLARHTTIDVLINNAGWISEKKLIEETTDAEYTTYMRTNVDSVFYFLRAAIPAMKKQKEGILITIGSGAGIHGNTHVPIYSATKFAVHGLMQSVAKQLSDSPVSCITVAPGGINTAMRRKLFGEKDASRQQSPEAVAHIIARVVEERAFSNGDEIEIRDGAIAFQRHL